ncbi:AMP-binding protein [Mangrovibacter sp. MFB070]|uniref:AMP-binding protein n=1 Tax=Mangrovibacter sp. MFB070 TaxID=1224318 RepID=UPI0009072613|nr:AMP-binding protein [Mangrovibacter sp. MFB070]
MLSSALESLALNYPGQPAVNGLAGPVTWRELNDHVCRMATILTQNNIRRLAVELDNGLPWVIADLACLKAGVVMIPVPLFFSEQQKDWLLLSSSADARLATSGKESWHTLDCPNGILQQRRVDVPAPLAHDTVKITFTSGTTGEPKGVCLREKGINFTTQALAKRLAPLGIERHLVVLPFATLLENLCGLYLPLTLGVETVVLPLAEVGFRGSSEFDLEQFITTLTNWQPQSLILVPELLRLLLLAAQRSPEAVRSLKFVAVGGGKVPPALLLQARKFGLPVYEGYGLSECGSVVALNVPGEDKPGTVGKPLEGLELQVDANDVLHVSGPVAMAGYLGHADSGNAIDTGDIARVDDQGFLAIEGRHKHIQITAFGRNFSPEWVESEAMLCPAVLRLVVYGEGLTRNVALVHCLPGHEEQARAQLDALNERLPDYVRIGPLIFTDEIAKPPFVTPNGRLRRRAVYHHFFANNPLSQAETNHGILSTARCPDCQRQAADAEQRHY